MNLTSKRLAAPLLLIAWCAFAIWQVADYRRERDLLRATLQEQAHSILHAVIGGVESHRRRVPYYREQLQGMIDELVHPGMSRAQRAMTLRPRAKCHRCHARRGTSRRSGRQKNGASLRRPY